jgi:hypothetical protein
MSNVFVPLLLVGQVSSAQQPGASVDFVWERRFTRNRKSLKTAGGAKIVSIERGRWLTRGDPRFGMTYYTPWVAGEIRSSKYSSELAARVAALHFLRTGIWLPHSSPVIQSLSR